MADEFNNILDALKKRRDTNTNTKDDIKSILTINQDYNDKIHKVGIFVLVGIFTTILVISMYFNDKIDKQSIAQNARFDYTTNAYHNRINTVANDLDSKIRNELLKTQTELHLKKIEDALMAQQAKIFNSNNIEASLDYDPNIPENKLETLLQKAQ